MISRWPLTVLVGGLVSTFQSVTTSSAQVLAGTGASEKVILLRLATPVYPPLARAALVSGVVEVALQVRPDGGIESAEVVQGHPLLKAAALDSARNSQFECPGCNGASTSYSIYYDFGFTSAKPCCQPEKTFSKDAELAELAPGVVQTQNHISVRTEPFCVCDPGPYMRRDRSMKCLFLWRCGKRHLEASL
jgi:TonB family protein